MKRDKDALFVLTEFVNGVNGIGMSVWQNARKSERYQEGQRLRVCESAWKVMDEGLGGRGGGVSRGGGEERVAKV